MPQTVVRDLPCIHPDDIGRPDIAMNRDTAILLLAGGYRGWLLHKPNIRARHTLFLHFQGDPQLAEHNRSVACVRQHGDTQQRSTDRFANPSVNAHHSPNSERNNRH